MGVVVMDYALLRSQADIRLAKIWDVARKAREESEMLCLLALAYYVRTAYPDALNILLEESDQDPTSMRFCSVELPGEVYVSDCPDDDGDDAIPVAEGADWNEDTLWSYAVSLDPRTVADWAFWENTGGRYNTAGYLKIDELIEHVAQHVQPITDPMPDPNDLRAVEAWLEQNPDKEGA